MNFHRRAVHDVARLLIELGIYVELLVEIRGELDSRGRAGRYGAEIDGRTVRRQDPAVAHRELIRGSTERSGGKLLSWRIRSMAAL
jgi:hypothetical protein